MSTAVILPALAPDVERKEVAGGLLLRHPRHGTQLLIPQEERPAVEAMDGSRSLELLEQLLAPTRGTLGYQSLVMLLFRLWDRGLLSNEDEVRQALFPHRKKRTLDRARSRTKWLQALVSFSILGEWVAGAFRWLGFLGRPLLSLPMLDVLASLTVVAGVFLVMGVTPWPEHLFRHEGSWLAGIVVFYGGLAGALSLRGLARAAALEGAGTGLTRAGIRVIAGIIHFDVDDTAVFHLPRATQVRFAALGLLVPGGLAGVLLQVEALVAGPWDRLGAAALLALFANLCPFLQTDGARLAEQGSSVDRQRFRVRTFLSKGFLRGGGGGETARMTLVAVAWIGWFCAGAYIANHVLLNDLVPLQAAVLRTHDLTLKVVGGVFFVALVCLILGIFGTVLFMGGALLLQLLTPKRVDKPSERSSAAGQEDLAEVVAHLQELSVASRLPVHALRELATRAEVLTYPAGARIQEAGGEDRRIVWVLGGHVELVRHLAEGEDEVVADLGPGEHFGDECLSEQAPAYDAVARDASKLLVLDGQALRDVTWASSAESASLLDRAFSLARFLDGISELAGLSPSARLELAFHVTERTAEAGEVIVREGDASDCMYLLHGGRCQVTKRTATGEDEYVADIESGQAFGEIGLLFSRPRTATVTCTRPSALVEVPRESLEHAMKQSFHVGLALEKLASDRLSEATR